MRRRLNSAGGQWLVLAATVLWGTTGTAQAFAPAAATPASIGAVRLAIGALALILLAGGTGRLFQGRPLPRLPALVGGAGIAAYQLAFFAAVARTGVAAGTVVAIGSSPVFAGVLEWAVAGRRPGSRWVVATAMAVAGCALLVTAGDRLDLDPLGVGLALAAGLSYAVYALASKAMLDGQPPDKVMAAAFGLGAILLSPLLFMTDLSWLAEPTGWAVGLHLGVVSLALAYALFARGLQSVPVSAAVTLSLGEPLTAAALGVVVLGERLSSQALAGIGLLFAGLALLALTGRARASRRA